MLHGKLFFFWGLLFWAATAGVAPVLGGSGLGGAALDWGVAAPHTVGWLCTRHFLLFSFLAGATWRLVDSLGGSAHAISCFFFFDGCYMAACG